MVVTYNKDIPDAPNNPSNDQPKMKTNTNAIDTIIAVDHYTFADAPSGTHKQVTFSGENTPGAQIDPVSTVYTANGTAAATTPQLTYKNSLGTFTLSCLRAWGVFAGTGAVGPIATTQIMNASVAKSATGTYVVTIAANATSSNNYAIHLSHSPGVTNSAISIAYTISSTTSFTIFTRISGNGNLQDCSSISFSIVQI